MGNSVSANIENIFCRQMKGVVGQGSGVSFLKDSTSKAVINPASDVVNSSGDIFARVGNLDDPAANNDFQSGVE